MQYLSVREPISITRRGLKSGVRRIQYRNCNGSERLCGSGHARQMARTFTKGSLIFASSGEIKERRSRLRKSFSAACSTPAASTLVRGRPLTDVRGSDFLASLDFWSFFSMTSLNSPPAWSRMNPSRERKRAVSYGPATKVVKDAIAAFDDQNEAPQTLAWGSGPERRRGWCVADRSLTFAARIFWPRWISGAFFNDEPDSPPAWSRIDPSRERKRAVSHGPATKIVNEDR